MYRLVWRRQRGRYFRRCRRPAVRARNSDWPFPHRRRASAQGLDRDAWRIITRCRDAGGIVQGGVHVAGGAGVARLAGVAVATNAAIAALCRQDDTGRIGAAGADAGGSADLHIHAADRPTRTSFTGIAVRGVIGLLRSDFWRFLHQKILLNQCRNDGRRGETFCRGSRSSSGLGQIISVRPGNALDHAEIQQSAQVPRQPVRREHLQFGK